MLKLNKMRKISIILIMIVAFASCSKEDLSSTISENKITNTSNNYKTLVEDFEQVFNTEYTINLKENNLRYEINPYDSIGFKHNITIDLIFTEGFLSKDISYLLEGLTKHTGLTFTESPDFYPIMMKSLAKMVYFSDMSYNPFFINTIGGNFPEIEKSVINLFFGNIISIKDPNERIFKSKKAEEFIINSSDFSNESKKRILTTFALYRYSTYYWSDKKNPLGLCMQQCDLIDAIGAYIATHADFPDGVMEDGADVNNYASAFSSIIGFVLWPLSVPCF